MSCRRIRDERRDRAQLFPGREAGGAEPAGPPPPARSYPDPVERREQPAAIALREVEQKIAEAYQNGLRDGDSAATQRMAGQVKAKVEQLSRSIEQLALHRGKIQR